VQRGSYPTFSVAILGAVGRTTNIECLWTARWTVTVLVVPEDLKIYKSIQHKLLEVRANDI
jgi:hypothetical protein